MTFHRSLPEGLSGVYQASPASTLLMRAANCSFCAGSYVCSELPSFTDCRLSRLTSLARAFSKTDMRISKLLQQLQKKRVKQLHCRVTEGL